MKDFFRLGFEILKTTWKVAVLILALIGFVVAIGGGWR